jgi:hypothetical protein
LGLAAGQLAADIVQGDTGLVRMGAMKRQPGAQLVSLSIAAGGGALRLRTAL